MRSLDEDLLDRQCFEEGTEAITTLLHCIGEDTSRQGLRETPARAMRAWLDWCSGYKIEDPKALLKVFEDGAEGYDEMVIVKDIEFYSHCEHHMAPFFGKATVGYIPQGRVVGLSKIARVVDAYAKRLQVQERLTQQVASCLQEGLDPLGVGVVMQATHFCMCSRGVGKQSSSTVTSALTGVFRKDPAVRAEFLSLARDS